MDKENKLQRYLANWRGERDSIFLYGNLSHYEKNTQLAKVYEKLALAEGKHAKFWEAKIRELGGTVPEWKPSFRSRALSFLAGRFGAGFVLPAVSSLEHSDQDSYDTQPESKGTHLPRDERSHARIIQAIAGGSKGVEGGLLARLEGRHRTIGGNALRAAVLGANDGLVSNLSLIMGVAGANFSGKTILIAGFAGLLAGAFSMAMGEWLSVQSSRELYTRQIEVEAQELEEAPEDEEEELKLIYEAKGFSVKEAERFAHTLIKDRKNALKTLSREELGIDPETLGGSAWAASAASFILFAIGAFIPLAPFLFMPIANAVLWSVSLSALALFGLGSLITLFTGRGPLYSGLRQLFIGIAAAAVTFGVGKAAGVILGG